MQSSGNFSNGSSEPVDGDDDEFVSFSEPAHTFGPAGPVTTGASGRAIGEKPVGRDARSCDRVVLLVNRLLTGRNPEVCGCAHRQLQQLRSDKLSCVTPSGTRTRL